MSRLFRIAGIFVFIAVAAIVLWMARTHSAPQSRQGSLQNTMHSAMTNPVSFAKNHFTGGVGAIMVADPATGALLINKVLPGSPAETAGLLAGDHILQVDGVATRGRTLAQNVESIRGFTGWAVGWRPIYC